MSLDSMLDGPAPAPMVDLEEPRQLTPGRSRADSAFVWSTTTTAAVVLVITGAIGVFLGYQIFPTLRHYGFGFLTRQNFNPEVNVVGIGAAIYFTVVVAIIALIVAFPAAVAVALYITEYAPRRLRGILISMLDLMAAVPSLIYGVWGVKALEPHLLYDARWISEYLGFIPLFKVSGGDPGAAKFIGAKYEQSAFVAGVVVSLMVIPLAASVMRNVFSQTPAGEREAAMALGSKRWGVIRAVVLPFSRGGIIGGTMLGLGRALGETIAVLFLLNEVFQVKPRILESGFTTISSLIAGHFGEATGGQLDALLAAGFVLFLMTLVVNTLASIVVGRSRSGASTDI